MRFFCTWGVAAAPLFDHYRSQRCALQGLTVLHVNYLMFQYIALSVICQNDRQPSDFPFIVKKNTENIWLAQPCCCAICDKSDRLGRLHFPKNYSNNRDIDALTAVVKHCGTFALQKTEVKEKHLVSFMSSHSVSTFFYVYFFFILPSVSSTSQANKEKKSLAVCWWILSERWVINGMYHCV